jgi:hypothetical protein
MLDPNEARSVAKVSPGKVMVMTSGAAIVAPPL